MSMMLKILKERRGTVLLVALTLFPLVPWVLMSSFSARFESLGAVLTSISQISALLGTVLLSLVVLCSLSPRFSGLLLGEGRFSTYTQHLAKSIAVLLLLAHPLVLVIKLIPSSVTEAAHVLLPGGGWALSFGVYALTLLIALYGMEFLARRSGALRHAPQVMGSVLLLGTLHAFFVPSDVSQSVVLKIYILSIVAITFLACLQRAFSQVKNVTLKKLQRTDPLMK